MRLNSSIAIATITLLIGIGFAKAYLWIPATVLGAGAVWLLMGRWVASGKRGSAALASEILALLVNSAGIYAALGQFACLVLVGVWFLA